MSYRPLRNFNWYGLLRGFVGTRWLWIRVTGLPWGLEYRDGMIRVLRIRL